MPRRKLRIVPLQNSNDLATGSMNLGNGLWIKDISGLLTNETFKIFQRRLSQEDLDDLLSWDLSLVHEYESDLVLGEQERYSEILVRLAVAALRWIHPTETTDTWFVQGFVSNEELAFESFTETPSRIATLTAPQFAARPQPIFLEDQEARMGVANTSEFIEVSRYTNDFRRIALDQIQSKNTFVPIVIALRLAEQAYLDFDVRLRLLKRVMALEALFSTGTTYGRRALADRVPKFIGEDTFIYPSTRVYTVGGVIADLCDLRNSFAHGDDVTPRLLSRVPDPAVVSQNVRSYADVLRDASAAIVRMCFVRIFRDGLVDTFSNKATMESLF